jgi:hypothetical protein
MVTFPVGRPSFSRSNRYNGSALYVQDTDKITPRLTLNANCNSSHAIDNISSTFSSAAWGTYDLPLFKGDSLRDRMLGGWELAPIFTTHSASPFPVLDCGQAYQFCPRASINGVAPRSGVTNLPTPGVPDNHQFYNLSNFPLASYVNP